MLRLSMIFLFVLSATSCGTSRVNNFYLLTANSKAEATQSTKVAKNEIILGIGPVTVPDYLQRSQIAYSMAGNQLVLSSENQWSEPLDKAVARVIAVNLSRLNPNISTLTFPWRTDSKPKLAVRLTIVELNRQSQDQAELVADWTLVDLKSKQTLHRAKFSQSTIVSEFSYSTLTEAYSDLLAVLSNDINEVLVN